MEITLIRHGKPESASNERLNSTGFAYWVKRYNHAKLATDSRPSWQVSEQLDQAYLVSSDLKRAKHSAHILFQRQPEQALKCLREMDIPRYSLPFILRAWTWVYLNRGLWMLGKKGKFESYAQAKERSQLAAQTLVSLSQQHGSIVAVAHGFLNLHVSRYLQQQGWTITEKNHDYWGKIHLQAPAHLST